MIAWLLSDVHVLLALLWRFDGSLVHWTFWHCVLVEAEPVGNDDLGNRLLPPNSQMTALDFLLCDRF